uniref:Structure-specific endonuclease subunit SLX1 C-terminal domain-containing protein n=1 Tax=Meleagris gallopavo TaxID=9103 RepID=G1NHY7_MELGA
MLPRLLWAPPWRRLPLRLRWLRPPPGPALCPAPPPHVVMETDPGGPKPRPRKRPATTLATPPACTLCLEPCEVRLGAWNLRGRLEAFWESVEGNNGSLIGYFGDSPGSTLRCPHPPCPARYHARCLAPHFLGAEPKELLPLGGNCPSCQQEVLWGELIGCGDGDDEWVELGDPTLGHWTDELLQGQQAEPE